MRPRPHRQPLTGSLSPACSGGDAGEPFLPGSLSAPQLSVPGPRAVQRSSQVKKRSTKEESEVAKVTPLYRMTVLISSQTILRNRRRLTKLYKV